MESVSYISTPCFRRTSCQLIFATDENACAVRPNLLGVRFAAGHRKDVTSTICDGLIALRYNEDAIEHHSSDIVIVRVLNIGGFRIKRLSLDLGIPSRSKLGFEVALSH